jgi:hypothetical protein
MHVSNGSLCIVTLIGWRKIVRKRKQRECGYCAVRFCVFVHVQRSTKYEVWSRRRRIFLLKKIFVQQIFSQWRKCVAVTVGVHSINICSSYMYGGGWRTATAVWCLMVWSLDVMREREARRGEATSGWHAISCWPASSWVWLPEVCFFIALAGCFTFLPICFHLITVRNAEVHFKVGRAVKGWVSACSASGWGVC